MNLEHNPSDQDRAAIRAARCRTCWRKGTPTRPLRCVVRWGVWECCYPCFGVGGK
jgi:hypothetical protein